MTKIKNYELDSTINDDDKVIGTDGLPGANFGRTKNYSIASLVTYIDTQLDPVDGSGTLNTIPIWTPDGDTLGDSIMTYDTGNTAITVGGKLIVSSSLNIVGNTTAASLTLQGYLADAQGQYGTAGQLLSSTVTGVDWIDAPVSGVQGSGTLNSLPMWTPDGVTLGDSIIKKDTTVPLPQLGIIVAGKLSVNGLQDDVPRFVVSNQANFLVDAEFEQGIRDASGGLGTSNQVLTSTGTQTSWQGISTLVPNNITGSGTVEYIPKFTPDGTAIGNSIMFTKPSGIEIQVGVSGGTETTIGAGFMSTGGLGADTLTATSINAGATGTLTASGNIILGDATADTTIINSTLSILSVVKDSTDTLGTVGQVLAANAASELLWLDQADTTYSISSQQAASDVEITLLGSDVSETEVTLVAGNSITLTDNGSNGITIAATGGAANTTYSLTNTRTATSTRLDLVGSDSTTDPYTFISGTGVSFDQTVNNTTTISIAADNVTGSGTLNKLPLWTPDGQTLGDSVVFQDSNQGVIISSPSAGSSIDKLTVRGLSSNIVIQSTSAGDAFLTFKPNVTSNSLGVFDVVDPTPGTPSAKFAWKKGASEYMRLDTVTGNLGIGTTTATHKLTVEGQSAFKATDGGVIYFNVNKDNASGDTFIGTGVLGSALYVGAPTGLAYQDLEVLGKGKFRDGIKDTSDSVGTSGQILTSTGSQVQWVDLSGLIPNNVTGTGTANYGVLWGPNDTLTDSLLRHGDGVNSVGIGLNNDTQGLESIAFTKSTSRADYSFALGYESVTDGEFSVTLGKGTYTAGRHAMATNYKSLALGQSSFAGGHTSSTGGDGAVALGHNASAGNFGAAKLVSTFPNDQTTFDIEGIVGTVAAGLFMRYGENLDVPDPRIEVLTFTDNGNNSATLTIAGTGIRPIQGELVVFEQAVPFRGDHQGGVALGNDAYSLGEGAVSIGHTSVAEADKAVALGDAARASGIGSVAIGVRATVTSADTIALGGNSTKILINALAASSSYADDVAAAAGGVAIGELYRNGNVVQIRLT